MNNLSEGTVTGINTQKSTVKLAKMGLLVAISILLVYFIHFPIFGPVSFLEYDPADIPILVGTFAFGPAAGLLITVVTAVLQGLTVSAQSGLYGILMHVIATGAFVITAGLIYKYHKTFKGAIVALLCGVLAMTAIMVPANYFITPYFMGAPVAMIVKLFPFIIGFNLIKAGINALVTLVLYKRISKFLHR